MRTHAVHTTRRRPFGIAFAVFILLTARGVWAAPIQGISPRTRFFEGTAVRSFFKRNRRNATSLADSGGHTVLLSPGLQYILTHNLLLQTSGQVPVVQKLYGNQLETDYTVLVGFRWLF